MSAQKWADIMDDEDNVIVRPGVSVSRRPSIRPRRSFSDSFLGKKTSTNQTKDADAQSVHEPTSD